MSEIPEVVLLNAQASRKVSAVSKCYIAHSAHHSHPIAAFYSTKSTSLRTSVFTMVLVFSMRFQMRSSLISG